MPAVEYVAAACGPLFNYLLRSDGKLDHLRAGSHHHSAPSLESGWSVEGYADARYVAVVCTPDATLLLGTDGAIHQLTLNGFTVVAPPPGLRYIAMAGGVQTKVFLRNGVAEVCCGYCGHSHSLQLHRRYAESTGVVDRLIRTGTQLGWNGR